MRKTKEGTETKERSRRREIVNVVKPDQLNEKKITTRPKVNNGNNRDVPGNGLVEDPTFDLFEFNQQMMACCFPWSGLFQRSCSADQRHLCRWKPPIMPGHAWSKNAGKTTDLSLWGLASWLLTGLGIFECHFRSRCFKPKTMCRRLIRKLHRGEIR